MEKTPKTSWTIGRPANPALGLDELVVSILSFLAADERRFAQFLAATGVTIDGLRSAATAPGFAESLLDHLCGDPNLLLAYADDTSLDPGEIDRLLRSLAPAFDP